MRAPSLFGCVLAGAMSSACNDEAAPARAPAPPTQRAPAPFVGAPPPPPPTPPSHDPAGNRGSTEDPGGERVTARTPLAAGDAVHVEWNEKWYAGEVVELLPDGSVRVHYVGWAPSWDAVAARTRLRLPEPAE